MLPGVGLGNALGTGRESRRWVTLRAAAHDIPYPPTPIPQHSSFGCGYAAPGKPPSRESRTPQWQADRLGADLGKPGHVFRHMAHLKKSATSNLVVSFQPCPTQPKLQIYCNEP